MLIITNRITQKDICTILGEREDFMCRFLHFRRCKEYKYVSFTLPKLKRWYSEKDIKVIEKALKTMRENKTDKMIVRSKIQYVR